MLFPFSSTLSDEIKKVKKNKIKCYDSIFMWPDRNGKRQATTVSLWIILLSKNKENKKKENANTHHWGANESLNSKIMFTQEKEHMLRNTKESIPAKLGSFPVCFFHPDIR